MKIYNLILTVLLLAGIGVPPMASAQTPAEVLGRAAARIEGSRGISCRFTVKGGSNTLEGNLVSAGKKFCITTPGASTWYDGKTMWTVNPSTKEVTITEPTAQEVAETNPLSYLHGYNTAFRLFFSRRKEKGRHLVLLNPRKEGTGVKAVEIAIDSQTYNPVKMTIRFDDDRRSTVGISELSRKAVSPSSFVFPAEKYRGYEMVDLR